MKLILTVFVFLFISSSAFAQSNERKVILTESGKYVSCGHDDHGHDCGSWTFVPDLLEVHPNVQASPASPSGACTPRPYRQLVAYDDALLTNYTHQQIVDLVMKGHKQFADALDSSGIQNQVGSIVVGVLPVKIPSYTKLSDVLKWAKDPVDGKLDELYAIKNDSLDADHVIIISREGISASEKGINLQFINNAAVPLDLVYSNLWKKNFGIVNFITLVPNFTVTYAHESGHSVGGGHENDTWSPTYARAYVNSVKGVNCLMKGATVTDLTYNRFSGPNSKIVKNRETIVMCEDTAVHNNAKHISECLDLIWCATENHITRVTLPSTTCGSGKLQAITNNADTFQWKVLSGDCNIAGTGKEISYMAMSLSKIQVIAKKKGKWYADTAYITVPPIEKNIINASIQSGSYYILPSGDTVSMAGTYNSVLKNKLGCDSIVIVNLSVITSSSNFTVDQIAIAPNPVHDKLYIRSDYNHFSISKAYIINTIGTKMEIEIDDDHLNVQRLPAGFYVLMIHSGNKIHTGKFTKI